MAGRTPCPAACEGTKSPFGPVACTFNRLPHGQFGWSRRARSWTFAGQAAGDDLFPYRLVVVDYPKR